MSIEDVNYYNDHRVRAARDGQWYDSLDEGRMKATLTVYDEDTGEERVEEVDIVFEVCPTCDGRGSHVNPSVDSNGLTAADFAEDPDFAESYFSGSYDVPCYECGGKRVVPVCQDEEVNRHLAADAQAKAEIEAEYAAERRMGA